MTEKMFFDTDCLSSFLWVGREDIILSKYNKRIVIPQFVYDEFCRPCVAFLRIKVDNMLAAKLIMKMDIPYGSDAAKLFRFLTKSPEAGSAIIGKGEASAIALAKFNLGIVASNNLRDVKKYTDKYDIPLITTADILVEAFTEQTIREQEANQIWFDMLKRQRKLPANSFSVYLRSL
jgi:predicted nucleic acid-binding protein